MNRVASAFTNASIPFSMNTVNLETGYVYLLGLVLDSKTVENSFNVIVKVFHCLFFK